MAIAFYIFKNKLIFKPGPSKGLFFWSENFKFEENADHAITRD